MEEEQTSWRKLPVKLETVLTVASVPLAGHQELASSRAVRGGFLQTVGYWDGEGSSNADIFPCCPVLPRHLLCQSVPDTLTH